MRNTLQLVFLLLRGALALLIPAVLPAQAPVVTGVYNYMHPEGRFAAGVLAYIFGTNLASPDLAVQVGGRPAAVLSQVTPLIQIQFPTDLPEGPTTLVATTSRGASPPLRIFIDSYAPVIGSQTCPHMPESGQSGRAKETSAIWAAGLGATDPAVPAGIIPLAPAPTVSKPSITVGGKTAEVLSSVLGTWQVGIYHVTFRVPPELPDGIHLIVLSIGGQNSYPRELIIDHTRTEDLGEHAPESIASAFACGGLANTTAAADARNPPTILGGTTVKVTDANGTARPARIQYVSPTQVNFIIPAETVPGHATVTFAAGDGTVTAGKLEVYPVKPELFCGEPTQCGFPAGQLIRVRNGIQSIEPVGRLDKVYSQVPIDLGPETDQVFLILYGSGLRYRRSLANVNAIFLNPLFELPVDYAGAQGEFPGLDQVNVRLPRSLAGHGNMWLYLTVDGADSTITCLNFK